MIATCPICEAISFNPHDAVNHYCGRCHRFYTDPAKLHDPNCPRCQFRGKHQVYSVKGELGTYVFDVTRARRIVHRTQNRPVGLVPPDLARLMLEVNEEYHPPHLDHVDPSVPGIVGQRFGGICLIDGNHRARRCLRDGLPFHAYMLDLVESRDCLMHDDQIDFTPELMAREIRGMLKNNKQCEMLTTVLSYDDLDGDDPQQAELEIRKQLTPEENARFKVEWEAQHKGTQ